MLTTCRRDAARLMQTLGANDVIITDEDNIEKNLQMFDGYVGLT